MQQSQGCWSQMATTPADRSTKNITSMVRVMGVLESVDALLKPMKLEPQGEVNAAIARSLASQLDSINGSTNGQMVSSVAGLAKELRAVLDALMDNDDAAKEFLDGIFDPNA